MLNISFMVWLLAISYVNQAICNWLGLIVGYRPVRTESDVTLVDPHVNDMWSLSEPNLSYTLYSTAGEKRHETEELIVTNISKL